jgi:inorganic pyrophosphatase
VGDNVGDIAGMGADLFGSFAESTCAALVVAGVSELGRNHDWPAMMFPLMVSATGILVCLLTTLIATGVCACVCVCWEGGSWVCASLLLLNCYNQHRYNVVETTTTDLKPAKHIAEIEHTLKMQLIISTTLMTPVSDVNMFWCVCVGGGAGCVRRCFC